MTDLLVVQYLFYLFCLVYNITVLHTLPSAQYVLHSVSNSAVDKIKAKNRHTVLSEFTQERLTLEG